MTSPDQSTEIVDEMIARLRQLQGSGEFVPLGRRIIAGPGLAGGGSLADDITISASPDVMALVEAINDAGGIEHLATDEEVAAAVAGLVAADRVAPRAVYRDFTVMDSPATRITAPAVRVDTDCTLVRVSVTVGTPGTQPVPVIVDGTTVTVPAGASQATQERSGSKRPGDVLRVMVDATDAAGIVVSCRLEEPGVRT